MAASSKANVADALGVDPSQVEMDFKVRRPDDPEKTRRDDDREKQWVRHRSGLIVATLTFTLVFYWVSLHYGKPEQGEKVVATIAGVVGGFGAGRWKASKD